MFLAPSNLCRVARRRAPISLRRGPRMGVRPEVPDQSRGLQEDPPGHLRPAGGAVREDDRYFDDPETGAVAKVVHLYLKAVTVRPDAVEVEGLERLPAEALETSGAVLYRQVEEHPRVEASALADQAPRQRPVLRPTARHVARADHHVRQPGRLQQARQVFRTVGEVRVHL